MELWDLYNIEGEKTGQTHIRGDQVPKDRYHLVVHIVIKNSNGDFLIQKRSDNKESAPGQWAFTGGSATSGETSLSAALRELEEETGIKLENLKFRKRLIGHTYFADIWFGYHDVDVETLEFQVEEVSALDFQSVDTIKQMIKDGTFHSYEDEYLNEVFKI
ncbi:NUDIX domain-containing protein [Acidaminobacter sp. JC074]|uniref:NUDIX hydrolase n=1 Tax=Acidaminobacter sp. JC074 TaxID=2530199 RepID=UPI001F0CF671|nr:NUDIX domain-containing protein [Acidaminobacter sp. JC074]MCH4889468.1 NUDIX domain-containing protein [Acidaminobacter sp. JC074]